MANIFARKPLDKVLKEMEQGQGLKRVLGPVGLTAMGIGAIIGTGIFVLIGKAARDVAGPALILSFVVAGLACIFSALCYAEFASLIPIAGGRGGVLFGLRVRLRSLVSCNEKEEEKKGRGRRGRRIDEKNEVFKKKPKRFISLLKTFRFLGVFFPPSRILSFFLFLAHSLSLSLSCRCCSRAAGGR